MVYTKLQTKYLNIGQREEVAEKNKDYFLPSPDALYITSVRERYLL